jgi:hypothetical protein
MVLDSGLARRAHRGCGGPPGQVPEYGIVVGGLRAQRARVARRQRAASAGLGDDY